MRGLPSDHVLGRNTVVQESIININENNAPVWLSYWLISWHVLAQSLDVLFCGVL